MEFDIDMITPCAPKHGMIIIFCFLDEDISTILYYIYSSQ